MPSNFNLIAPVYDQLAFFVFGNNLTEAKKAFIRLIPENSRILLMGGGTGMILNFILEKNPSVSIDFVEPSSRMTAIAKKSLSEKFLGRINFINGDENSIPEGVQYDVCTSFFVMDCFVQAHALSFARAITSRLKQNGIWLFADFFGTNKFYHRFIVRFMYRFFKIVSRIESSSLPDYEKVFQQTGFRAAEGKIFMSGLVKSLVLIRN